METGLQNRKIKTLAMEAGLHHRVAVCALEVYEAGVAALGATKCAHLSAKFLRLALEQAKPTVVGVQDCDAARRQAFENLRLGLGDPKLALWKVLDVDRSHSRHNHGFGVNQAGQGPDLALVVHADLEDRTRCRCKT